MVSDRFVFRRLIRGTPIPQKIGVNVGALQQALDAVQKDPSYQADDEFHFLKSAVFYTRDEFEKANQEFFAYALENSPKVKSALDKAVVEGRDGILVLTFEMKGEGRTKQMAKGGELVYFCDPVTGEVLFFRGGK